MVSQTYHIKCETPPLNATLRLHKYNVKMSRNVNVNTPTATLMCLFCTSSIFYAIHLKTYCPMLHPFSYE